MERLAFGDEYEYSAIEGAIHLTRYALAKDLCKDKKVLDIACGEGYGSYFMGLWGAKHIEAVDISKEAIDNAAKRFPADNINYVCHQAQKLDYPDSTFDLVVSLETIEHLDKPEVFLKEIKRVLKPSGTLILSCPNDAYFINVGGAPENPYHKKRYTFKEFSDLAESYFGGNCNYFLGYAAGGFINLPIQKNDRHGQYNSRNPFQMFQYKENGNYFEIPSHLQLNTENSSYYVGIWGRNEGIVNNAVFYAKDQCNQQYEFELLNKVRQIDLLRKEYDELYSKYSEIEKNNNRAIEVDRLHTALQLSEKEKNIIRDNMCLNWEAANKYQNELEQIYNSRTFRCLMPIYKLKDKMHRLFK